MTEYIHVLTYVYNPSLSSLITTEISNCVYSYIMTTPLCIVPKVLFSDVTAVREIINPPLQAF